MSTEASYLYSLGLAWLPPTSPYWRLESEVRLALTRELDGQIPPRSEIEHAYEALVSDKTGGTEMRLPIQSLYEPWTLDPDCHLVFARARGLRRGDAALHMDHVLSALGVELPSEIGLDSDHVAVILNAAGVISERLPGELAAFTADHLSWLEEYRRQVDEAWGDDLRASFYRALLRVTIRAAEPSIASAARLSA